MIAPRPEPSDPFDVDPQSRRSAADQEQPGASNQTPDSAVPEPTELDAPLPAAPAVTTQATLFPDEPIPSDAPAAAVTGELPASGTSSFAPTLDLAALLSGEEDNAVADEAELVPACMLNEFTDCPRLAYLEWVQREFRDNLETNEGTFGHRRVDRPTTKSFDAPSETSDDESDIEADAPPKPIAGVPGDSLAVRSLSLTAPTEGLLATLDLIELEGRRAVPIDYKRGSVPDNPQLSWVDFRGNLSQPLSSGIPLQTRAAPLKVAERLQRRSSWRGRRCERRLH